MRMRSSETPPLDSSSAGCNVKRWNGRSPAGGRTAAANTARICVQLFPFRLRRLHPSQHLPLRAYVTTRGHRHDRVLTLGERNLIPIPLLGEWLKNCAPAGPAEWGDHRYFQPRKTRLYFCSERYATSDALRGVTSFDIESWRLNHTPFRKRLAWSSSPIMGRDGRQGRDRRRGKGDVRGNHTRDVAQEGEETAGHEATRVAEPCAIG